jgi:hypothetical protein
MDRPSSVVRELALDILRRESTGSVEPAALAAALDQVFHRLGAELENLVGPTGVGALVRRALILAWRQFPCLEAVSLQGDSPAHIEGLEQALVSCVDDREEATAAVLSELLGLLVRLLGSEMGLRPVRDIWPLAAAPSPLPESTDPSHG